MKILLILFALYASAHAVIIQCNFGMRNFNKFLQNVYTCQGSIISFEKPSIVTEIRGQHLAGRTNDFVAVISVFYSTNSIPSEIGTFFPNLLAFLWDGALLRSFRAEDLEQFPNIISIYLRDQWIESLDGDSFKFNPKLKEIHLSSNQLRAVGNGLLADLPDLQYADFRSNICIDILAQNVEAVQALSETLPIKCPPLTATTTISTTTASTSSTMTTTENVCDIRCSMNEEVDELQKKLAEQSREQNEINARNEERLLELELQIREILAVP